MNTFKVSCLDTNTDLFFSARTPYEAMQKLLYHLNLSKQDNSAVIQKTESGLHLYVEHSSRTYAVRM